MALIMNLYSISLPSHVIVKPTEKNFFNKYPYKVSFTIDHDRVEPKYIKGMGLWAIRAYHTTNIRKLVNEIKDSILDLIVHDEYRFRLEHDAINFYTTSEEDVKRVIKLIPDRLASIHYPLNDRHKEVLFNNHSMRVRRTLFENKFKYKVYLKYVWNDRVERFKEVSDWLTSLDGNSDRWQPNSTLRMFMYTNFEHRNLGLTVAFYLNDVEDVLMSHLKFNSKIDRVEEVLLLTDL